MSPGRDEILLLRVVRFSQDDLTLKKASEEEIPKKKLSEEEAPKKKASKEKSPEEKALDQPSDFSGEQNADKLIEAAISVWLRAHDASTKYEPGIADSIILGPQQIIFVEEGEIDVIVFKLSRQREIVKVNQTS